ncbi:MAG: hypothetical protein H0X24_04410 [Ktedonobacterales bacterium]|nr:hypothetical protein [Ktedonobacterales bacterium]
MESPTPFYNSHERPSAETGGIAARLDRARVRFRRLNRSKQGVLVVLASLGALVLTGTFAYAISPDDVPSTPALVIHTVTPTADPFTGSYVLADGHTQAQILTLHAYHGGFTGTLQTLTCAAGPHTTQAVVTGTLAADGALRLNMTVPTQPHSTQTTYRVLRDADGTTLLWQDPQHPTQTQPWTRLDQPLAQFIAGWC